MRPGRQETTGAQDLFRARLDEIINLQHELVRLAETIDWDWVDAELAQRFSAEGWPGTPTRFTVGLLLLEHIYTLSDEGGCASGGCTTPISSTSPARRSSSTPFRTSARG